jgi:hypothetical protein
VSQPVKLIEALVGAGAFRDDPVVLVDVGASGGISRCWRLFGECLQAIGFEPFLREVDRLNAESESPRERYEAFFVGCPQKQLPAEIVDDPTACHNTLRWLETSASEYQQITGRSHAREVFNRGDPDTSLAAATFTLDEYFFERKPGLPTGDFNNIDTDGSDLQVLFGAERLLREKEVLGIQVEAQLHGRTHPYSNTFANIDQFLRERGFALFDFPLSKYSRRALPAKFAVPIPARTETGQTHFGDALYFRDLADPLYEKKYGYDLGPAKALKLAGLFALFGIPDCAADIIVSRREEFERLGIGAVQSWLDSLVPPLNGVQLSYEDYMSVFRSAPQTFLKGNDGHEDWGLPAEVIEAGKAACRGQPMGAAQRTAHLRKERDKLKQKVQDLRSELGLLRAAEKDHQSALSDTQRQIEQLRGRLAGYRKRFGWVERLGLVK